MTYSTVGQAEECAYHALGSQCAFHEIADRHGSSESGLERQSETWVFFASGDYSVDSQVERLQPFPLRHLVCKVESD